MPYNNASDPELISQSAAVVVAFTPQTHAHVMSLFPTPEAYSELHGRMEGGYAAFLRGDPAGVKAFEENRDAVKQYLTMLYGLAKVATIMDPTVPEMLGLGRLPEKSAPTTVPLTDPQGLRIFYDRNGQLFATVIKVPGAKGYQVWICVGDPNVEANWKLAASSTNSRSILIPAIDRTKNTWVKARAMRGTVAGPWSSSVTLSPV